MISSLLFLVGFILYMANASKHPIKSHDYPSQIPFVAMDSSKTSFARPQPIEQFASILDSYIVAFKAETTKEKVLLHYSTIEEAQRNEIGCNSSHGIIHKYEIGNWRGYSGKFSPSIVSTIQTYGEVDYIEQDKYVQSTSVQYYAPWGLARISSRKALDSNMHNRFIYSKDGGKNTTVYILDTGIYKIHKDFGGRVSLGKSFSNDPTDADLNGHGTHSAGIVGGHTYGVAKKDNLVSVKISDEFGNGTTSDAIAGIEWIVKNHIFNVQEDSLNNWRYKGAVGLLNFITYKSLALNNSASFQGISMVVPAGNSAYDACQYSPASATYAITVGASTYYDREASYSNYGDCVDIYAPGQNILSAWNTGTDAKHVLSGTSTAAAYIAGLAAYYTGNMKQQSIPEYIKKKILSTSTPDVILTYDNYGQKNSKPLAFYEIDPYYF